MHEEGPEFDDVNLLMPTRLLELQAPMSCVRSGERVAFVDGTKCELKDGQQYLGATEWFEQWHKDRNPTYPDAERCDKCAESLR